MRINFYRAKIASTDNKLNVIKLSHTQKKIKRIKTIQKALCQANVHVYLLYFFLLLFTDNKNCVLCLFDTLPQCSLYYCFFCLYYIYTRRWACVRLWLCVKIDTKKNVTKNRSRKDMKKQKWPVPMCVLCVGFSTCEWIQVGKTLWIYEPAFLVLKGREKEEEHSKGKNNIHIRIYIHDIKCVMKHSVRLV